MNQQVIDDTVARDLRLIALADAVTTDFESRFDNIDDVEATYDQMAEDHINFLTNIAKNEVFETQDKYNSFMGIVGVAVVLLSVAEAKQLVNKTTFGGKTAKDWWAKQKKDALVAFGHEDPTVLELAKTKTRGKLKHLIHNAAHAVNNFARLTAFKFHPFIRGMQQISILDDSTTDICNKYAYKKWYLNGKPYGHNLPYNGGPPRHIGCRSTIIPIRDLEAKTLENNMKQHYCNFEIKSVDEQGTIEGYGSFFGNEDSYGDIVAKGAFKKTINERTPAMLWQHDPSQPIGVWQEMKEDNKGLWVKGKLNLETVKGRETYALLKEGAISGLSIGFIPTKWDSAKSGIRTINEVKLFEISVVTFPANELATVTEVKTTMINKFNELDFVQQAKVLAFIEGLKALDISEPCNPDETVNPQDEVDNEGDTEVKEAAHSLYEAAEEDVEPLDEHSAQKLIKLLRGEL